MTSLLVDAALLLRRWAASQLPRARLYILQFHFFFAIISYYLWLQYIFLCRPDDQCARASRCRQLHGFNFTYIQPGCVKLSKFAVWCQTTSAPCCTAAERNNSNVTSNTLYDGAITHGWEKITNCERDMKLSFYLQQAQQQLQLSGKSH